MAGEHIDSGSFLGLVSDTVSTKLANFQALSDRYGAQLNASLAAIGNITVDDVPAPLRLNSPAERAPSVNVQPLPEFNPSPLAVPSMPSMPSLAALLDGLDTEIEFRLPDAPDVVLPAAPVLRDFAVPQRPDADMDVSVPDAPDLALPDFDFAGLLGFFGQPPSVDFNAPNTLFDWREPEYRSEILDEVKTRVSAMLQGGTGLPPEIEAALFARAREREDNAALAQMQQITDQWAARGFSLPSGVLDKQLDAVREQNRLKASELNRDVLVQAATWEIENLRFAVQQGLALEQMTINLFLNTANRLFEAAKFRVESEISVFNARVALFNARISAFGALAEFVKAKLSVVSAQTDLFQARAGLYKTAVEAAHVKVQIAAQQFDAYKTEIQAYAEQIGAEKAKFQAYEAQLSGEETKVKAYAALVGAVGEKADVAVKQNRLKLEAAEAKIKAYNTQLAGFKAQLDASLGQAQFETQSYAARVDAFKAENSAAVSQAEMQSRFADMNVRTNIAYAQMQTAEYEAKMRNALQKSQIALESAKALGQYTAQLAAGAMSAQHVSASMGASTSYGHSTSKSESTSHNYSY